MNTLNLIQGEKIKWKELNAKDKVSLILVSAKKHSDTFQKLKPFNTNTANIIVFIKKKLSKSLQIPGSFVRIQGSLLMDHLTELVTCRVSILNVHSIRAPRLLVPSFVSLHIVIEINQTPCMKTELH